MKKLLLTCTFFCIILGIKAQMQGGEATVQKNLFTGTFVVNGDKNTYYPVVFKNGNQNLVNQLKIWRGYNEAGPTDLHPTHKGSLLLEIDVNYGGWGGITYDWRIEDYRVAYHTTFADASFGMHHKGFILWLRGGGFVYHYQSNKASNLQVCYSTSEKIYDHPTNDGYDVMAPPAKTAVNQDNIDKHLNGHYEYIKRNSTSVGTWQKSGNVIYNSNQNVGIGTTNATSPLTVAGKIDCREVKVFMGAGADFVFNEDYPIKSLEEVEAFVKQNKHLPEIAPAAEMEANGLELGEMNIKLLQKVEELTLYLIELNKENKELKSRIEKLETNN